MLIQDHVASDRSSMEHSTWLIEHMPTPIGTMVLVTDDAERVRKTALMKEVNTAYESNNLLALLQLQLKARFGRRRQQRAPEFD